MNNLSKSQMHNDYQFESKFKNNPIIYKNYINLILSNNIEDFLPIITKNYVYTPVTVKDIPQFSQIDDASIKLVDIIIKSGDCGFTFDQLGLYLTSPGKKKSAYKKYGENHAKFAELLDLVFITKTSPRKIYLTGLGKLFYSLHPENKNKVLIFQMIRLNIVVEIINNYSTNNSFIILDYLKQYLSESTAKRRSSNVKAIFKFLAENDFALAKEIISLF